MEKQEQSTGVPMFLFAITLVLFITALGALGYFTYDFYTKYQKLSEVGGQLLKGEPDSLDADLQKIILLPNEKPSSILTVSNAETLRVQSPQVYSDIQNGDLIIVYSTKAIIFRPSEDKIISVVPLKK